MTEDFCSYYEGSCEYIYCYDCEYQLNNIEDDNFEIMICFSHQVILCADCMRNHYKKKHKGSQPKDNKDLYSTCVCNICNKSYYNYRIYDKKHGYICKECSEL